MRKTLLLLVSALATTLSVYADDAKLTGTVIGCAPNNNNNAAEKAFDGDLGTFFRGNYTDENYHRLWVGLDLGKEYVITKIGFAPRQDGDYAKRAVLSLFQGANKADFSDAMPIAMVREEYSKGEMHYIPVNVSRGFRYVRFMGVNGVKGSVAELEFYGHEGVGDDSQFFQITNLPTVAFNTPNMAQIMAKDDKHPGSTVYVISDDGKTLLYEANPKTQLKGRGNASWGMPKKPFQIKFENKQQILKDAPAKAKKWTLINNHGDKTLMRNHVAFEMSRLAGMAYTPYLRFVDVVYNGEYEGCYQLCDQVEVNKNRVNIEEIDINEETHEPYDPNADITGGYFLEVDGYANKENEGEWFSALHGGYPVPVTIKSPEDMLPTSQPYQWIKKHFEKFLASTLSIQAKTDISKIEDYLNIDSFLKYFIIGELDGNPDTFWSTYMFKPRGVDQFTVAPIWDVDLGFDNDNRHYPINTKYSGFIYEHGSQASAKYTEVVKRIVSENPDSKKRMKEIWSDLRYNHNYNTEHFNKLIDDAAAEINESQKLNFTRWPILNTLVHQNPEARGSFEAEVQFIKDYLVERFAKLDQLIGLEEPPAGIDDIIAGPTGPARYYNLSGVEVNADNLTPGVYIKVDSTGSKKVLVK